MCFATFKCLNNSAFSPFNLNLSHNSLENAKQNPENLLVLDDGRKSSEMNEKRLTSTSTQLLARANDCTLLVFSPLPTLTLSSLFGLFLLLTKNSPQSFLHDLSIILAFCVVYSVFSFSIRYILG